MKPSVEDNPSTMARTARPKTATQPNVSTTVPLREAYDRLQTGDFGPEALRHAEELEQRWATQVRFDDLEPLTAANYRAEVFDYYGRYGDARNAVAPYGPEVESRIEAVRRSGAVPDQSSPEARALWRARVALLANYSHVHYRREEYEAALRLLNLAADFLDMLDENSGASFNTRWRLNYQIGQAQRQLNRFEAAERSFTLVIENAALRLKSRYPTPSDSRDRNLHDFRVARWAVAKSLVFGLGWVYFLQGRIEKARPLVATGRTLFYEINDWLHIGGSDLLMGAITRTTTGRTSSGELDQTITEFRKLHDFFSVDNGVYAHDFYRRRTAFELAHAYLYSDDTEQALTYVQEVIDGAVAARERRWHSLALTLKSRIERESRTSEYRERAIVTAKSALHEADLAGHVWCRIEALIALGEAEFAAYRSGPAVDPARTQLLLADSAAHLLAAYRLIDADNPKTRAVCCLHLARVAIASGDRRTADEYWRIWTERFAPHVQAEFVRQLAGVVSTEIAAATVLVVDAREGLDYDSWRQRLQGFLVEQAHKEVGDNASRVADLLKISRQTLYEWKKERK